MEDELDDYPEQFSPQTREALDVSVAALVDALQRHAKQVGGMRGGSSDVPAVFDANAEVEQLIAAWNERVFDHTGTFPVSLQGLDEDGEDFAEDEEDPAELEDGEPLSVVSRWDLSVVDSQALLQAGRDAHRRLQPDETEGDAAVAVPNVGQAVYALLHEHGEPWYDMPGVEVVSGLRAYVRPDEQPTPLSEETDYDEAITQPPGERLFGESWG